MNAHPAKPWLSILIPVYNVAPYLEECLASIAGQIDDGVEVIALDDASTDRSGDLLTELQQTLLPRITILRHPTNQGISAARNHMLEAATGTYVWFIDSDDLMSPGAIQAAHRIIREHAPDLIGCNYLKRRLRPRLKHRLFGNRPSRTFFGPTKKLLTDRECVICGSFKSGSLYAWARVFRRAIHPTPDLFPVGRFFEDTHGIPRLFMRAQSYYHEPAPWVVYRERHGSVMRTLDAAKAADIALSLKGLHDEFATAVRGMGAPTQYAVSKFCTQMYVGSCRHLVRSDKETFHRRRRELISVLEQASPLSIGALVRKYSLRPKRWLRAVRLVTWRYQPDLAHRLNM